MDTFTIELSLRSVMKIFQIIHLSMMIYGFIKVYLFIQIVIL